jgi:hypothetical protein
MMKMVPAWRWTSSMHRAWSSAARKPAELMSEDDSADPRTGMTVAQRFVDANVSAVLGPYNSGGHSHFQAAE